MFKIKIADLIIGIDNKYDFVKNQCRDYIDYSDAEIDFTVSASDFDIENEKKVAVGSFSDGYLESICVYRNLSYRLPEFNAFLFHCALVEVDGEAYAFTAKSGTGKSTHIMLWKKLLGDKMTIINGDKPILRVVGDKIMAYGTPWCGKEGYNKNTYAPLKAICFIERGEIDRIFPFEKSEAAKRIIHQIVIPKETDSIVKILELLDLALRKVDVWRLECTMNISAASTSYNAMKGGLA